MLESAVLLMPTDSNNIEGGVEEECGSSSNVCKYGGGCVMEGGHTNCIIDPTLSIPAAFATHTNVINTHIDDEVGADVYLPMGIGCNEDGWESTAAILRLSSLEGLVVGLYMGCFRSEDNGFTSFLIGFYFGFFVLFIVGSFHGVFVAILSSSDRRMSIAVAIIRLGFGVGVFIGSFTGLIGAGLATGMSSPTVLVYGFSVFFFLGFSCGFFLGSIGGVVVAILTSFVSFIVEILTSLVRGSFFYSRDPQTSNPNKN